MSLPSNGSLSLSQINSSVRFTNGNLSIGDTNTDGKLYLYDASTVRIKIQVPNATTQIWAHSDTKSYFQSSGDIEFTGIESTTLRHLYLPTSGNVGIGTETPLAKLHVTQTGVLIGSNSGDYIGGNLFWTGTSWTRGNSNAAGFALRIGNSGDAYGHGMQIVTMDTANGFANRMLVGANGNVGIGTTNPNQKLEVAGGRIQVTQTGAVSAVMEMANAVGTSFFFNNPSGLFYLFPSNTSSNLILNADEGGNTWGSIAVGTSNPNSSAQLHVNSSIFLSTGGSLWLTGQGDSAPNRLRLHQAGATGNGGSYIDFMGGPLCFRSGSGSLTNLLTLTTEGNIGLGTAPSSARLTVSGNTDMYNVLRVGRNSNARDFLINLGAAGIAGGYRSGYIYGDGTNMFILNQENSYLSLFSNNGANGAEVRLTSSTNLGVGTNNPQSRLHIRGSPAMTLTTDDIYIIGLDIDSTNKTGGKFWRLKSTHQSASEGQGKFIIANETNNLVGFCASPNGAVSIGTMTPANNGLHVKSSYGENVGEFQMGPSDSRGFHMYAVNGLLQHYNGTWGFGLYRGQWYNNGLQINGSLSKGSGSFDIQHPLHPDDSNKRLVHSFVEGPRCDLIYRGQVILVNGIATINLDTDCVEEQDCGMSLGTFEALCANPQILLQNVTSFSKIRGRINGNILTIESQDTTSTDIISWSVIAERKDPYIKSWERTNTNGYLKTEYIKSN